MIFDLILFCAGMLVIFLMKLSAQDKTKLLEKAASSALVAGSLVTVIKLLVLVSSFEHMELPKEEVAFTEFLIKIFVNLRPLFFGILIRLILMPFEKRLSPPIRQPIPLPHSLRLQLFFPAASLKLPALLQRAGPTLRLQTSFIFRLQQLNDILQQFLKSLILIQDGSLQAF